jgi:ABC-type branched-subunit amino acid transport system ATPase component
MTVAAGRMHGFVGRNGAGKTTAMRWRWAWSPPIGARCVARLAAGGALFTRGRLKLREAYARAGE